MDEQEQNDDSKESVDLPEGFHCVSTNELLCFVILTMSFCIGVASSGSAYVWYVLVPFAILLAVIGVVSGHRVRRYLRKHGDVRIVVTFSPETARPKKSIWSRDIGDMIDHVVDRALDGKGKDNP